MARQTAKTPSRGKRGTNRGSEPARWRRLVEEQTRSGLTQESFCKERGLPFHRFHYWKYEKLREADENLGNGMPVVVPVAPAPAPAFVPVEVVFEASGPRAVPFGGNTPGCGVEVILPQGIRIGLERDFDGAVLRRVVEVLGC